MDNVSQKYLDARDAGRNGADCLKTYNECSTKVWDWLTHVTKITFWYLNVYIHMLTNIWNPFGIKNLFPIVCIYIINASIYFPQTSLVLKTL